MSIDWPSISTVIHEVILRHGNEVVLEIFYENIITNYMIPQFNLQNAMESIVDEFITDLIPVCNETHVSIKYVSDQIHQLHGVINSKHNMFKVKDAIISSYGIDEKMQLELIEYFIGPGILEYTHHSIVHIGFCNNQLSIHVILERFVNGEICCHQFIGYINYAKYMKNRGNPPGSYQLVEEKRKFGKIENYASVFENYIEMINEEWERKQYIETTVKCIDNQMYTVDWNNSAGCHLYAVTLYEYISGEDVKSSVADEIISGLMKRQMIETNDSKTI
eukprot:435978_1